MGCSPLTAHSLEGNTGKGRTKAESYPGHGPLFSNALTGPKFPRVGCLLHRTSQCYGKRKRQWAYKVDSINLKIWHSFNDHISKTLKIKIKYCLDMDLEFSTSDNIYNIVLQDVNN